MVRAASSAATFGWLGLGQWERLAGWGSRSGWGKIRHREAAARSPAATLIG